MSVFLLMQCEKNTVEPFTPPANESLGKVTLSLNIEDAPVEVVQIKGRLFRNSSDTLYFDFEIKNNLASASITDLAADTWTLIVDALNSDGTIIYTGTTKVTVQPGVVTPVYLHLNPTTGSLEIVVTWGGAPFLFDSLLIAYYPFDNSLTDLSKYNNQGIEFGGINYLPGIHNGAVSFDGHDDFVEISHIDQYNIEEKTIAFWFYKANDFIRETPSLSDCEGLVFKGWDSGPNRDFSFTITNQQPPFQINGSVWDGSDSLIHLSVNEIIEPMKWYFVTQTIGLSESKLYLNGNCISTVSYTAPPKQNEAPVIIGKVAYNSLPTRYFNGIIDELIILKKVLSSEQVNQIYNGYLSNQP